ncbi:MAG: cupin domain-containing protein [Actinomycetia bacterium]|nr:cupin domain-containing protein [Actinomycetes bacterium]
MRAAQPQGPPRARQVRPDRCAPHQDTDELFLVVDGELTIQLRDGAVVVRPGQLYVVPRSVEHLPRADGEVHAVLVEPADVVNTGDAGGSLTADYDDLLM